MRRKSLFSLITKAYKNLTKEPKKTTKRTSTTRKTTAIKTNYNTNNNSTGNFDILNEVFKYANMGDIETVEKLVANNKNSLTPMNLHFLYNRLQEVLYKKRDEDPRYIQMTKDICLKDFELIKSGKVNLPSVRLPCINRLITICENTNDLTTAMEVLQYAVDNQWLGNYSYKFDQLRYKTSIDGTVPKPKRIKEKINENGLCEREVKLIELLKQEVQNRGLNVSVKYYTKSNGVLEIRFDDAYITQVKIKNNADEYFEYTINQINDWINNYINYQNHIHNLIKK